MLPGFRTEHVSSVVRSLTEDETVQVEVLIEPVYFVSGLNFPVGRLGIVGSLAIAWLGVSLAH